MLSKSHAADKKIYYILIFLHLLSMQITCYTSQWELHLNGCYLHDPLKLISSDAINNNFMIWILIFMIFYNNFSYELLLVQLLRNSQNWVIRFQWQNEIRIWSQELIINRKSTRWFEEFKWNHNCFQVIILFDKHIYPHFLFHYRTFIRHLNR